MKISLVQIFLFLATVLTRLSVAEKCENTLGSSVSLAGDPPVTQIPLKESCNDTNTIIWNTDASIQLLQFRMNHRSFTLCMSSSDRDAISGVTITQLRQISKRVIYSPEQSQKEIGCIESQCNHVSLLLDSSSKMHNAESSLKLTYQYVFDHRCPKCSDQCMKNILCNSDYIFIGTVSEVNSVGNMSYKSRIELEEYIRYNNTFNTLNQSPECRTGPSTAALTVEHPINTNGEVTVYSNCYLKPDRRYFIAASLRVGYKRKGRLMVGCCQEDVDYGVYILQKLLREQSECC